MHFENEIHDYDKNQPLFVYLGFDVMWLWNFFRYFI